MSTFMYNLNIISVWSYDKYRITMINVLIKLMINGGDRILLLIIATSILRTSTPSHRNYLLWVEANIFDIFNFLWWLLSSTSDSSNYFSNRKPLSDLLHDQCPLNLKENVNEFKYCFFFFKEGNLDEFLAAKVAEL